MSEAGLDVDQWLAEQPDIRLRDSADAFFWYEGELEEGEEPIPFSLFADKVDKEKERRAQGQ